MKLKKAAAFSVYSRVTVALRFVVIEGLTLPNFIDLNISIKVRQNMRVHYAQFEVRL